MQHGIPIRTEKVLRANHIAEFMVGQHTIAGPEPVAGGDVCQLAVGTGDVNFEMAVWKRKSETTDASGVDEEGFVRVEGGLIVECTKGARTTCG
jgi:hypothetical protein